MALRVFLCNVKVLNTIHKWWLALEEFKSSKADVVMVQETQFHTGGSFKFAFKQFPIAFVASDPSGRAGVAILIKRSSLIHITSSFLDPHGRFILLNCVHMNTPFTLANIYAPNSGQIWYLTKVFEKTQSFSQPFMIIGGDFNMCMSLTKDRYALFQTMPPIQAQKQSTSFCEFVRWYNLFDTWRVKHPTHKQYTFYPPSHKLYSRLDNFFANAPLLTSIVTSDINHITWSDHVPIVLDLTLSAPTPKTCHWCLNEILLQTPEIKHQLQHKFSECFQLNKGTVSETSTLWEAHNVFLEVNAYLLELI